MSSPIDSVLDSLCGVKPRGHGKWFALCPVHNEKTGSLSVAVGDDGQILLHCFGCGAGAEEIAQALGMELEDLWPAKPDKNKAISKPIAAKVWTAEDRLAAVQYELSVAVILLERLIPAAVGHDDANVAAMARLLKAHNIISGAASHGVQ